MSALVVARPIVTRSEPFASSRSIPSARITCDGSVSPDVQADPLDTEKPGRLRAQESAALASSIFLIGRKRRGKAIGSYETDVQAELAAIVCERVETLWDHQLDRVDPLIDVDLLEIIANPGDAADLSLDVFKPLVQPHRGDVFFRGDGRFLHLPRAVGSRDSAHRQPRAGGEIGRARRSRLRLRGIRAIQVSRDRHRRPALPRTCRRSVLSLAGTVRPRSDPLGISRRNDRLAVIHVAAEGDDRVVAPDVRDARPPELGLRAAQGLGNAAVKVSERYAIVALWGVMIAVYSALEPSTFDTGGTFQTIFGSQAALVFLSMAFLTGTRRWISGRR